MKRFLLFFLSLIMLSSLAVPAAAQRPAATETVSSLASIQQTVSKAITPKAGEHGGDGSIFQITHHGVYTVHDSHHAMFVSQPIPYGRMVGKKQVRLGYVTVLINYWLKGKRGNIFVTSVDFFSAVDLPKVAVTGALQNGAAGKMGRVIQNCHPIEIDPYFSYNRLRSQGHLWCAEKDYINADHNMLVRFNWDFYGYRATDFWGVNVVSPIAHGFGPWWNRYYRFTTAGALGGQYGNVEKERTQQHVTGWHNGHQTIWGSYLG